MVSIADVTTAITETNHLAAGKAFAAEGTTAVNFILLVGEATGTDGVRIYYVQDGTGADDMTVDLVGTLSGISLLGITDANLF